MTISEISAICREAWTAKGLSDKTIHAYLLVVRRAQQELEKHGSSIETATATEIRDLAYLWRNTRSSRVQLRTALGHAWEALDRTDPPRRAIPVPSKPRYSCRAVSEPAAAALAALAHGCDGPEGLAVLLGLYAGLRRFEIAALRWDHMTPAGELQFIGKRDITRQVPIHPRLIERLEKARADAHSPFVFPGRCDGHVSPTSIWLWVKQLSASALGLPVSTHILRHTAIATLNDATGDLRAAQAFAGHLSPETTAGYTRVSRERLVAAVARINYGG